MKAALHKSYMPCLWPSSGAITSLILTRLTIPSAHWRNSWIADPTDCSAHCSLDHPFAMKVPLRRKTNKPPHRADLRLHQLPFKHPPTTSSQLRAAQVQHSLLLMHRADWAHKPPPTLTVRHLQSHALPAEATLLCHTHSCGSGKPIQQFSPLKYTAPQAICLQAIPPTGQD